MTIQVNIAEAKAKLSELVSRAEAGEEVLIARAGRVAVELRVPLREPRRPHRRLGALASRGPLSPAEADVFLGPDPELERLARAEDEEELYR